MHSKADRLETPMQPLQDAMELRLSMATSTNDLVTIVALLFRVATVLTLLYCGFVLQFCITLLFRQINMK